MGNKFTEDYEYIYIMTRILTDLSGNKQAEQSKIINKCSIYSSNYYAKQTIICKIEDKKSLGIFAENYEDEIVKIVARMRLKKI